MIPHGGLRAALLGAAGLACLSGVLVGAAILGPEAAGARQEAPFQHEEHAGLFPVCTGCHAGIETAEEVNFYPPASQCAGCHDGRAEPVVSWVGPSARESNVIFDHVAHASELSLSGDPVVECTSCHSDAAGPRMAVDAAEELGTCWGCHAHERTTHFAEDGATGEAADCASCHVPMADAGFSRDRMATLPTPASHDTSSFLIRGHADGVRGDDASCATCHTATRCESCHVDASLPEIALIPRAAPDLEEPAYAARYPTPASHESLRWDLAHAPDAVSECSTCHTQTDCLSCHVEPVPAPMSLLPPAGEVLAPGVRLEVNAPASHDSYFFMNAHSNLAAARPTECASCHTETYCADCHDGATSNGYHDPSFVTRHAAEAYGQTVECATCHSTPVFCRACHEESGFASQGRLGAGFHDAEPIWLIRHGGAARQNLESCASCHQQQDCVQCHGVLGAFRVSPHSADFDAEAAWARSPRTCLGCHTGNPIGSGGAGGRE